jgi:hypothetical protein
MEDLPTLKDEDFGIFVATDEDNRWIYQSLKPETFKQARANIEKKHVSYSIYRVNGYFSDLPNWENYDWNEWHSSK